MSDELITPCDRCLIREANWGLEDGTRVCTECFDEDEDK